MAEGVGVSESVESGERVGRLDRITAACYRVLTNNMNVQPGEEVAIVADPEVSPLIVDGFWAACKLVGGNGTIVWIPAQTVHGEEIPPTAGAAMKAASVIVAPVSRSISHIVSLGEALRGGSRYIGLSSITEDAMLHGAANVDPDELAKIGDVVVDRLKKGRHVHVTSSFGTDIKFELDPKREVHVGNCLSRNPGEANMFPDGEIALCPVEESVEGTIVVDRWMQGIGEIVDQPITMVFKKGVCQSIEGGLEAQTLKQVVETQGDEYSKYIGEFAIGINPLARVQGNPHREGKKVVGSVHMAIGTGAALGGKFRSTLHLDGLMLRPIVTIDGKVLFKEGQLIAEK